MTVAKCLSQYMNANKEDEEPNEDESSDETEEDEEEEEEETKIDDGRAGEAIAEEDALNDSDSQSFRERDGGNCEPGTSISLVDANFEMQKTLERPHSPSPDGLSKSVEALSVSDIKVKVTSDLSKARSHQQRKYHSKRSTRQIGRPKGSKAKQDKIIKLDRDDIWG
jgi:RIO kinase 2